MLIRDLDIFTFISSPLLQKDFETFYFIHLQ